MSNKINAGGPAFPQSREDYDQFPSAQGMSLRDWFAGMALQGMLANQQTSAIVKISEEMNTDAYTYSSIGAFKIADAMLAEREKVN